MYSRRAVSAPAPCSLLAVHGHRRPLPGAVVTLLAATHKEKTPVKTLGKTFQYFPIAPLPITTCATQATIAQTTTEGRQYEKRNVYKRVVVARRGSFMKFK